VRTKIVPVTLGALRTIKKALDHNRQLLPDHRSATELQKITLMSTAQSNRRVLGGNRFDLLLGSGPTTIPSPAN